MGEALKDTNIHKNCLGPKGLRVCAHLAIAKEPVRSYWDLSYNVFKPTYIQIRQTKVASGPARDGNGGRKIRCL
jgi:hypothetical protein